MAAAVRAGIARARNDHARAEAQLRTAIEHFASMEMSLHTAAARSACFLLGTAVRLKSWRTHFIFTWLSSRAPEQALFTSKSV